MPKPTPPSGSADNSAIVARLEDFLVKYLEEAEELGIRVNAEQITAAIDEAINRCKTKESPAPVAEDVEAFFLDGISAALVEEQQGVYEKQKNEDGEEVYLVVSNEVWIQCLTALRGIVNSK